MSYVARAYRKARSTNATNTSFPSKVPLLGPPAADTNSATATAAIDLTSTKGGKLPCKVKVLIYGTGDANDVINFKLIAWNSFYHGPTAIWIPTTLFDGIATLGTSAGPAGGVLAATSLFADTITITKEPTITADTTRQGTVEVYSPADDSIAYFISDLQGAEKIEMIFDDSTGNPTGMNALLLLLGE